jgi:hypothetical protein
VTRLHRALPFLIPAGVFVTLYAWGRLAAWIWSAAQ